jgi:hypothetical protein
MRRLQKTYAVLVVVQFAANHECEFDVRRDRGDQAMSSMRFCAGSELFDFVRSAPISAQSTHAMRAHRRSTKVLNQFQCEPAVSALEES